MVTTWHGAGGSASRQRAEPQDGQQTSSADFVRQFGVWQDRASVAPVFVTHHGRPRHVLVSIATFKAMQAPVAEARDDDAALRLATLVHATDSGFVTLDARLAVTAINPAAAAFFRVSAQDVIGLPARDTLAEFRESLITAHMNRAVAAGEASALDVPSTSRPGEWLRCSIFPYGSGAGCLLRVITSERRAIAADAEVQALRGAIAAAGRVGCGRLTLRGTFGEVDEALAGLAGFAARDLLDVRLTDILPLALRAGVAAHVEGVLALGRAASFETALLMKQGEQRAVRIGMAPSQGDYGIDGATIVIAA